MRLFKRLLVLCVFIILSDISRSQNRILDSLRPLLNSKEDTTKVINLVRYGYEYQDISIDTPIVYYRKALALARKIGDKRCELMSIDAIARYCVAFSPSIDSSFSYSMKCLQLAKIVGSKSKESSSYSLLSYIYTIFKDNRKVSFLYADSAIAIAKTGNLPSELIEGYRQKINSMIGPGFKKTPERDRIIEEAIHVMNRNQKSLDPYSYLCTVAAYKSTLEEFDTSIVLFKKVIPLARKNHDAIWECWSYSQIADCYRTQKKYDLAFLFADSGMKVGYDNKLLKETIDNMDVLYEIQKEKGDYKGALKTYVKRQNFKDSISEISKGKMEEQYQKMLEQEKNSQEMVLLKKDKEIEQSNAQKQKQFTFFAVAGLILIALFAVFMFNRFKITQRQKAIIEEQKKIVDEKQKETMDSIRYAKRIQTALMPHEKYIDKKLKDLKS